MNTEWLKSKWVHIFGDSPEAGQNFTSLTKSYSSNSRRYHGLDHIIFLLQKLDEHFPEHANNPAIHLAIWYHDSVLSSWRSDNEARSAARAVLEGHRMGLSQVTLDSGHSMILATRDHQPTLKTPLEAAFLDLDLLVLAGTEEEYRRYTDGVAAEYRWLPGFLYRRGRKKVLSSILKRKKIFLSPSVEHLESAARENLENEEARLTKRDRIRVDGERIECRLSSGLVEVVAWDDLQRAEILTTDEGPYAEDVFWVLHGMNGGCIVPQGAPAFGEILKKLSDWPNYDAKAVIEAMGSTQNARFLVWERADKS